MPLLFLIYINDFAVELSSHVWPIYKQAKLWDTLLRQGDNLQTMGSVQKMLKRAPANENFSKI